MGGRAHRHEGGDAADNPLGILLAICNATPDIVVTFTGDGQPTFLNDAGRRFLGLADDAPLDRGLLKTTFPDWARRLIEDTGFPHAAEHGMWQGESAVFDRHGQETPCSQVILCHKADDGSVHFFSTILRDISKIVKGAKALLDAQVQARKVADATLDLLYILELPTRRILYANRSFDELFGPGDQGRVLDFDRLRDIVHPDDFVKLHERAEQLPHLLAGQLLESELRVRNAQGEWRWFNVRSTVFYRDDPTGAVQILNSAHDVTARRRAEVEEAELCRVMENALEGVACLDTEGHYQYVNPAYAAMCGMDSEAMVGLGWEEFVHPKDLERVTALLDRTRKEPRVEGEWRAQRRDGTVYHKRSVMIATRDLNGAFAGHYCFASDVTDQRNHELQMRQQMEALTEYSLQLELRTAELNDVNRQLESLASNDGLTSVPNHRTMQDRLLQEVSRSSREGTPIAFLLIDIDHFKAYNDTYGHPEGDTVLRTVAALLSGLARTSDIVARYGGEEFAVILPNTGLAEAIEIAERLRQAIEQHTWSLRAITLSIGAASSETVEPVTPGALIEAADRAMYAAKNLGRNQVQAAARSSRAA